MREGDAKELVQATGRSSYECAPVKRDGRKSGIARGSGGPDCGSCSADSHKQWPKESHDHQRTIGRVQEEPLSCHTNVGFKMMGENQNIFRTLNSFSEMIKKGHVASVVSTDLRKFAT